MDRSIIHINIADFAVAVERAADRRLRGRPVIVAPQGAARAAVFDMSEEAYRAGVRKGMALRNAIRLCSDSALLPPRPARYEQAMRALVEQAMPYSPLVEPGDGDGHLFVDATGTSRLFGSPMDVAWRLREQARKELGLDPIWSVAPNKLMAKVATRLVKPDGEYIVSAGEEEAFLAPLPVRLVPGIDSDDLDRLSDFNLTRVFEVAALTLNQLAVPFGKRAGFLYDTMRGIDPSPVLPSGRKPPAVMVGQTFGNDTNHAPTLENVLYALVEKAGADLRERRFAARRVAVVLDFSDGIRRVRQRAANPATANDLVLFEFAKSALYLAWTRRVRIRHMRLICDRLTFPPAQMALFPEAGKEKKKKTDLIAAVDKIRNRFGWDAIGFNRTANPKLSSAPTPV